MSAILEIYIVIAMSIFFMGAYAIGSRRNYKIQKKVWSTLSKELKPFCKSVKHQGFGSSGFRVGCLPENAPISKLEVTVTLLAREMPLYYVYSKFKGRHDKIIIRSNFRKPPKFRIEIQKEWMITKEMQQSLMELEEIKLNGFPKTLKMRAPEKHQVAKLFSSKALLANLQRLNGCIERLSIMHEEPQLLLICALRENLIQPLLKLVTQLGEGVKIITGR
ncbi:MAG: hypothetical protein AOA65_1572 [Candidatus Bathyarchaeota archaeon BA1]|nr:MAG: hypothetical protein AOA65_1572 [Candidatus Bathyarchaeota archaeon BA1]